MRPLLDTPRSEIEGYARRRRLEWIEDDSNSNVAFDRNFLRHQVLPLISQRYPAYRETLARARRNLAEAAQLLRELGAIDTGLDGGAGAPSVKALRKLSPARAKNALRYFLAAGGSAMPNAARLEEFVRQLLRVQGAARVALDLGGQRLLRFGDELRLVPRTAALPASGERAWQGEPAMALAGFGGTLKMVKRRGAGISLEHLLRAPVTVRARRGGERLQPDARRPRRTLKHLLQEARIAPWDRTRLPLLFSGETLVYVPGIGIDCAFQAQRGEAGVEPRWEAS